MSELARPSSDLKSDSSVDLEKAGERLQHVRGDTNQDEFADRYGIHVNTLRNYEKGKRPMDIDFAARLCRNLNLNPNWLLFGFMPKRGFNTLAALPADLFERSVAEIARLTGETLAEVEAALMSGHRVAQPKGDYIKRVEGEPIPLSTAAFEREDTVYVPLFDIEACAGDGLLLDDIERVSKMLPFERDYVRSKLGIAHNEVACLFVRGSSMEPEFRHKDMILIDRRDVKGGAGSAHVVRLGDELMVKNVQRLPGLLEVTSLAAGYKTIEVRLDEPHDDFQIIGRIRWASKTFP